MELDQNTPVAELLANIRSEYWGNKPKDEICSELNKKIRFNQDVFTRSPLFSVIRRSYRMFYTITDKGYSGFRVSKTGEQDELSTLVVPHYQSLIRTTTSLVTQNRPNLSPVAINSDFKSMAQSKVASSVFEYYTRESLEERWQEMAMQALVMGASYLKVDWDTELGEEDPLTNQKSGDLKFSVLTPFDITYDDMSTSTNLEWVIVREFVNKYELAAKYPYMADDIMKVKSMPNDYIFSPSANLFTIYRKDSDLIPLYTFYHERCAAVPQGREVRFLSDDIMLYDGPLVTRNIPIVALYASKIYRTPLPFSPFWGILGLQQMTDMVSSTLMSAQATFGGPTLVYEKDSGLSRINVGNGMQAMSVNAIDKTPRLLEMNPQSSSLYQALDYAKSQMQLVSGISDVARGVPPSGVTSGTALALLQAQSYINNSDFEKQYVKALEKTGSLLFEFLKKFAVTKRSISVIVGKSNHYMMQPFSSQDISDVNRVQAELTNPLQRTPAGRLEIAQNLMQIQNPQDRQTFVSLLDTGRMDSLTEAPMRQLMSIRRENEMLMDNQSPNVYLLDDHAQHIQEHRGLLADPEIRAMPELAELIMDHIDLHMNVWRSMTPSQLAVVGLQPLPPDMAPPPAAPLDMPQPGSPADAVEGVSGAISDTMPLPELTSAATVQPPKMPVNPATGEQWNPANGGNV